jgi:hypothetical protein
MQEKLNILHGVPRYAVPPEKRGDGNGGKAKKNNS